MAHPFSRCRGLLAVAALVFAAACGTDERPPPEESPAPAVLVIDAAAADPTGRADYLIDFGAVDVGDQAAAAFVVRNGGASALRLAPTSIAPPFATSHDHALELQAGDSAALQVRFTPTEAGSFETLLPLAGNDETQVVRLAGTATYAEGGSCVLSVDERPMHWGPASICAHPQELALANLGDAPCDVALSFASEGFAVSARQVTVEPRSVEHVIVWRDIAHAGANNGTLEVRAGDAAWHVPLTADLHAGFTTELFETDPRRQLDLLLVIDDSPAMAPYVDSLKQNAANLLMFLIAQDLDFRLGVTTTSLTATEGCAGSGADGRLLPLDAAERWITPETPDAAGAFARAVDVGTCSAAPNQGLAAAWRAVSELDALEDDPAHPEPADGNAGFVRRGTDARLSLMFVSASDDLTAESVATWSDRFLSIHGRRNVNMIGALAVVAPPGGCGSAEAGTRYSAFAESFGGLVGDLCSSDWSRVLERMGTSVFSFGPRTRFFLDDRPVDVDADGAWEDDIEVRVNGEIFPAHGTREQWAYVPETNAIDFMPLYIPEPSSTIEVTYTPSCMETP